MEKVKEKKTKDLVRNGTKIEDAFYGTGRVVSVMRTMVKVKFDKATSDTDSDGNVTYDNAHFNTFCKII